MTEPTTLEGYLSAEKYSLSPHRKLEMGAAVVGLLLKMHNLSYKIAVSGNRVEKPEAGSGPEFYLKNAGNFSYGIVVAPLVDAGLDAYKHRISENLEIIFGKESFISRAFDYVT